MSLRAFLTRWVGGVVRARKTVLVLSALSALLCLVYTAKELGMSTTTSGMFADDVGFRVDYEDFTASFPQFVDTLLIVVDGDNPASARAGAAEIADRTSAEPEIFQSVYWPGADPYFRRNGLLFLELDQLAALRKELVPFAPFFNALSAEPTLGRLSHILALALKAAPDPLPERLDALLNEFALALGRARTGVGPPPNLRRVVLGGAADQLGGLPGSRELVLVQPVLDYQAFPPASVPMQRLRQIAAEIEEKSGDSCSIRLTGEVALTHEEFESARQGALRSVFISLILVVLLLVAAFRSARFLLASLATIAIGFVWTSAFATAAVGHLNLISMAFAALYAGMGVDSSIHFCLYLREVLDGGSDSLAAMEQTAAEKGLSLTVAAVTTALAFLSFWPTDFDGVAELGIIAGGGMLIGLFANLTVLPALLALAPFRPATALAGKTIRHARLGPFLLRRARLARILSPALLLLSLPALLLLRFNPDPQYLRDRNTESVQAFEDLLANPRTSPHCLEVIVEAKESSAASPEAWSARKASLAALPSVWSVVSLEDMIPGNQDQKLEILEPLARAFSEPDAEPGTDSAAESRPAPKDAGSLEGLKEELEKRLSGDDETGVARLHRGLEETLSSSAEEQAEVILACEKELLGGLLAEMRALRDALSAEKVERASLPPELVRRWIDVRGRERMEVLPAEPVGELPPMRRFVGEVLSLEPSATGGPVVLIGAGQVAVASLRTAFACSALSIVVVLALSLRSARAVALAAFPLLLGGVVSFALCAVFGIALNFANMIGLPLLLGLAIDSGVHIVVRSMNHPDELPLSLLATSTGKAVLYSSVTTISGFVSLVLSPHWGTASLGWLMSMGMAITLVASLVALPAWLVRGKLPSA